MTQEENKQELQSQSDREEQLRALKQDSVEIKALIAQLSNSKERRSELV